MLMSEDRQISPNFFFRVHRENKGLSEKQKRKKKKKILKRKKKGNVSMLLNSNLKRKRKILKANFKSLHLSVWSCVIVPCHYALDTHLCFLAFFRTQMIIKNFELFLYGVKAIKNKNCEVVLDFFSALWNHLYPHLIRKQRR